ncbi:MAG: ABC transporter permease [Fibromonadales bacterium]|nr:ABC transporter permease [Fibromonadales bacterium]
MNLRLELKVAWRYLGAQRRSLFVSLISLFSMVGVCIGTFALIVALSAVNGFEAEVTDQMIGKDAHFEVLNYRGEQIYEPDSIARLLMQNDNDIVAYSPFIIYKVGVSSKRVNDGVVVYGIDTETAKNVIDLPAKMIAGNFNLDNFEDSSGVMRNSLILGSILAQRLRVDVGDKLVLQTFQSPDEIIGGGPRMMQFIISGIFETGMYEYDGNLLYVSIEQLQRLLGMYGVSGIQFKVKNPWKSEIHAEKAGNYLGYPFYATDWKNKNQTLLKWMNYEKFIVAAIVCLIVLIAAFNIISSLIMVVVDKTREIGILRSMGFSEGSIMRVFISMGSFIGLFGSIVGGITGLGLCIVQERTHIIKLPADVYMMPFFPVQVQVLDVVVVLAIANVLCVLSTILPAWKASTMNPVRAIRHE